jgi:hydrogenase-4 component H
MEMMTGNPNRLVVDVDTDKCIGCWACTHVCPADLFTFADQDGRRTLRFANTCHYEEDCTRCADACPEEAITLATATETGPEAVYLTATFDLLDCQQCGTPFTTTRIVDRLLGAIPPEFQTDAAALSWVQLCPSCRQLTEGERMAREWVMVRWPGEA